MKTIRLATSLIAAGALSVCAEEAPSLQPIPVTTAIEEGLMVWKTPDNNFNLWIDGRLFVDFARYREDVPDTLDLSSGSEITRFRLSFKATHWKVWTTELDMNYAENVAEIKDAWIGWNGIPNLQLKVGNFKESFGMENMTSSRYENFIESSYLDAFPAGRTVGAARHYSRWGVQGTVGIHQQVAGEVDGKVGLKKANSNDEAHAFTGRFSFNALEMTKIPAVAHFGASGSYRTPSASTNSFLYESRAETRVSKIKFYSATIKEADHKTDIGVESALQYKRFTVAGEYQRSVVARVDTSHFQDVQLSGGYVSANVFLTNDQQHYGADEGEFGKIVPKSKWGAVQLLGRYSFLDLNEGGAGKNITAGMTWHINTNHRILFNYTRVDLDETANANGLLKGFDDKMLDFDIYTIRFIALL